MPSVLRRPAALGQARQGHKLIRLGERYSSERLDAACRRALSVDLVDVRRLERSTRRGPRNRRPRSRSLHRCPQVDSPGRRVFASCQRPHRSISTRRVLMTTTTELTPAAQAPQARRRAQHPAGEGRSRTQGAARLRILPADHTDRSINPQSPQDRAPPTDGRLRADLPSRRL